MSGEDKWQLASIDLSGGQVDEKAEIALQSPEMALVKDGEFTRDGLIRKRTGTELLADFPSNKYDVNAALVHRKSLHLLTSKGAHNLHDTDSSVDVGVDQNPGPLPVEVTERPSVRTGWVRDPCLVAAQSPTDSYPALHVWAEEQGGQIWYRIEDQTTGSVIIDPTPMALGTQPRAYYVETQNLFVVLWLHTDGVTVKGRLIDTTTGTVTGSVTNLATIVLGTHWDAVVDTGGTLHVAFWAAGSTLTLARYTGGTLVSAGASYTVVLASSSVLDTALVLTLADIWLIATHITVAAPTRRLYVDKVSLSTYTSGAATDNDCGLGGSYIGVPAAAYDGGAHVWIAMSVFAAAATAPTGDTAGYTRIWDFGVSTSIPATYYEAPGHVMAAFPFFPSGQHSRPMFPTMYYYRSGDLYRSLQAYGQILVPADVSVENSQAAGSTTRRVCIPCGRWGSDLAQTIPAAVGFPNLDRDTPHPRRCFQRGDLQWAFDATVLSWIAPSSFDLSASLGGDNRLQFGPTGTFELGADEVRVDVRPNPLRAAQATPHGLPMSAGAMCSSHDGWQAHELSWQAAPEPPLRSAPAGAVTGKFRWKACWRWVDAEGRIRRSGASDASPQLDLAGSMSSVVTLKFLRPPPTAVCGVNRAWPQLEVYRQRDADDGVYRLVQVVDIDTESTIDLAWFAVTDTVPVAAAETTANQFLYTEGGELDNDALPAALDIASANGRVWVLSGEDATQVWPSKLLKEEGSQLRGPEWSRGLMLRLPEPARALASLDDRVVALCERGLYVIQGEGPDNLLGGAAFSVSKLAADFGVRDPRGVVECPLGVVFRGPRGVYLLGRDLALNYIGQGIEVTLGDSEVISALHVPHRGEVRLHLSATPSGANQTAVALVWSYLVGGKWAWWTHGAGCSVIRNDQVERIQLGLNSVPGVYRENDGFDDAVCTWLIGETSNNTGGYLFKVRTPMIRPDGRDAGLMMVRRAQFVTSEPPDALANIKVSYLKDYGVGLASGDSNATFAAADVSGARALEIAPVGAGGSGAGQECASIQFTFEETGASAVAPPTGQVSPPSVARLTLELALLPGLLRGLPATLRK